MQVNFSLDEDLSRELLEVSKRTRLRPTTIARGRYAAGMSIFPGVPGSNPVATPAPIPAAPAPEPTPPTTKSRMPLSARLAQTQPPPPPPVDREREKREREQRIAAAQALARIETHRLASGAVFLDINRVCELFEVDRDRTLACVSSDDVVVTEDGRVWVAGLFQMQAKYESNLDAARIAQIEHALNTIREV